MAKRILFLGKAEHAGADEALHYLCERFEVQSVLGCRGDTLDDAVEQWEGDLIVSYLSPWIVPGRLLRAARMDAINFHPGPPEHPGIGCFNFAIYDSAKKFGVSAHIMEPEVDTGELISVKRFSMTEKETVETLSKKTYEAQLNLYKDILHFIVINDCLPNCDETWKRKPYRRSELEDLATIKTSMNKQEIDKRIRATYYSGKPAPFIEFYGQRFEYNPDR